MASQRPRPNRGNARGGVQEAGEEGHVWRDALQLLAPIQEAERKAKDLQEKKIALERQMKDKLNAGDKTSEDQDDRLDALYRESVKVDEAQKAYLVEQVVLENPGNLKEMVTLLKGLIEATETAKGRPSNSRSAVNDFDGPSDSPGPSSAENKSVRKIGNGRTSSQPPRAPDTTRGDATPAEASDRPMIKVPKVVFHVGQDVAFKRRIQGRSEEQDWIQGTVTKVIGEGKSRRYEVRDPFPDETAGGNTPENIYKSSASQMVPIPALDEKLGDYELGKQVLALYPETTTFYRAEVKAMLNEGKDVQLLFEDEAQGALKVVERRMVLDHKG